MPPSMKRWPLHIQILIAIGLAVLCGVLSGPTTGIGTMKWIDAYQFVGDLFLNALRMLVVPLVVSSVVIGVAGIGSIQGFGRLGIKTIAYYITTTFAAVLVGLILVNVIRPGVADNAAPPDAGVSATAQTQLAKVEGRGLRDIADIFQRLVPQNVIRSAVEGDMLGLIFFSLLFGYFLSRLPDERQRPLLGVFQGLNDVMLLITELVMRFAPIGVFALVAKVVATTGLDAFRQVAIFFVTVVLGLAIHLFVVLPLMMRFLGRVNPMRHFRAMTPALLTAFSTASSSATLPMTMECVEKRAGVSKRTTSFVLPLGATVNMDGTALYECVAVLFIAQVYGIDLSFAAQVSVVVLALLTSIGVAGIPAASLVAIVIVMNAVGVPAEGLGLIFAVDRILDMCRTAVNVFSDSCGAVIIGRSEGERNILTPRMDA
jgi:proton glutamate symport protein